MRESYTNLSVGIYFRNSVYIYSFINLLISFHYIHITFNVYNKYNGKFSKSNS